MMKRPKNWFVITRVRYIRVRYTEIISKGFVR